MNVWCVKHRSGWCASFRGHKPKELAFEVKTACNHVVMLTTEIKKRKPTCPVCLKRVARRRDET